MSQQEQDLRIGLLNSLLTTPHRNLDAAWPFHKNTCAEDPLFYQQLAAWYQDHGSVRDHKELFVVGLLMSEFAEHRDVGLAMLRELPPYQLGRVVDFIHGRQVSRKVKVQAKEVRKNRLRKLVGSLKDKSQPEPKYQTVVERTGLFRNVPRSVKTEITRYLREREASPEWFDSTVLMARKTMKRLYALLHVPPSERAQQILFANEPPEDSRLYALRELRSATSATDQARAIVEYNIPYRVASTVIKQMTPTVLLALVQQMSPQEVINNVGALQRRGAMENPQINELIKEKLNLAKTDSRVSAFKAEEAIRAAGASGELRDQLEDIADQQVKAKGRIVRPTALLVDKSSSMSQAIELGKRIASMISAITEADLYVYAFDTMPYEVHSKSNSMADWERAFKGIRAGGATSCGCAIKAMQKKKESVEQIIMVTDEGDNTPPLFLSALQEYKKAMQADPQIFLVRTKGGYAHLENQCRQQRVPVDVFQFHGDYYSLPNLIPLLAMPSKLDLLMEIMAYSLPERKSA